MTTELMELRPDWTVSQAKAAIRKNGFDKETINHCYVTDRDRTDVYKRQSLDDVAHTLDGCIAKMAKLDKSINTTYFRQLVM